VREKKSEEKREGGKIKSGREGKERSLLVLTRNGCPCKNIDLR